MRVDTRLLGWGVFLVLAGAIPLAVRLGILDAELVGRWPLLWPVLLIAWGLGLLLRRSPIEWLGGALAAVTFGVMGGGLLASGFSGVPLSTGCAGRTAGTAFQTQSGSFATSGRLNVELNCGTLTMRPATGSRWSVSGTETEGRAPRVRTEGATVTIDSGQRSSLFDRTGRTDWTVDVPQGQEVGLGITINAGEGQADLGALDLGSVHLTVNAGSLGVNAAGAGRLGDVNATVNAGRATLSLPAGSRSGNLSLNAGYLGVCVPSGAAVRVTWSGALGSNHLDEAGLTKVDANTWQTQGFDAAQPYLDLSVSANAGSFELDANGTCDA